MTPERERKAAWFALHALLLSGRLARPEAITSHGVDELAALRDLVERLRARGLVQPEGSPHHPQDEQCERKETTSAARRDTARTSVIAYSVDDVEGAVDVEGPLGSVPDRTAGPLRERASWSGANPAAPACPRGR